MIEFELKFRRPSDDRVKRILDACRHVRDESQRDVYFQHPCRDFRQTDEAFRWRSIGDRHWITYKGPKRGGHVKARQEIEVPLATPSADRFRSLIEALGFRPVAVVAKRRAVYQLAENDRVHVVLDDVEELGPFMEIEIVGEEAESDAAGRELHRLAADWGLEDPEFRSYLELLLERRRGETRGPSRG